MVGLWPTDALPKEFLWPCDRFHFQKRTRRSIRLSPGISGKSLKVCAFFCTVRTPPKPIRNNGLEMNYFCERFAKPDILACNVDLAGVIFLVFKLPPCSGAVAGSTGEWASGVQPRSPFLFRPVAPLATLARLFPEVLNLIRMPKSFGPQLDSLGELASRDQPVQRSATYPCHLADVGHRMQPRLSRLRVLQNGTS